MRYLITGVATLVIALSAHSGFAQQQFISVKDISVTPASFEEGAVVSVSVQSTVTSIHGVSSVDARLVQAGAAETSSPLFDDGKHGDGALKDEVWGGTIDTEHLKPGEYSIVVTAKSKLGESASGQPVVLRVVARSITVQTQDEPQVVPPPSHEELVDQSVRAAAQSDAELLDALIEAHMLGIDNARDVVGAFTPVPSVKLRCLDNSGILTKNCLRDSGTLVWSVSNSADVLFCNAYTDSISETVRARWEAKPPKYLPKYGVRNVGAIEEKTEFRIECVLRPGIGPSTVSDEVSIAPLASVSKPNPDLYCQDANGYFTKGPCTTFDAIIAWGPSPDTSRCTAASTPNNPLWTGSKPPSGYVNLGEIAAPTTFRLACSNARGTVTQSVRVLPTPKKAKALIQKGSTAAKLDILFVSKGFDDQKAFEAMIRDIYSKGFASYSPTRENINAINIWVVKAENLRKDTPGDFYNNQYAYTEAARRFNPWADEIIYYSNEDFRPYAYLEGDAFIAHAYAEEAADYFGSLVNEEAASLVMHEFGHSFGALADEYVEPSLGDRPLEPNCLDGELPDKWITADATPHRAATHKGYFNSITYYMPGCSYVFNNTRSTKNSAMRSQFNGQTHFGAINEEQLLERLIPFTKKEIHLFAPKGGEIWEIGSDQAIRWVAKNSPVLKNIQLVSATGQLTSIMPANESPDDGEFTFKLPSSLKPGAYRVRITTVDKIVETSQPVSVIAPFSGKNSVLNGVCISPDPYDREITIISPGNAMLHGQKLSYPGLRTYFLDFSGKYGAYDFYLGTDLVHATPDLTIYPAGFPPYEDPADILLVGEVTYRKASSGLGEIVGVDHVSTLCKDLVPPADLGAPPVPADSKGTTTSAVLLEQLYSTGLPQGTELSMPRPRTKLPR